MSEWVSNLAFWALVNFVRFVAFMCRVDAGEI